MFYYCMELVGQTIIIGDFSQDLAQDSVVTLGSCHQQRV